MESEPKTRLQRLEEIGKELNQKNKESEEYLDDLLDRLTSNADQLSELMRVNIEKAIADYEKTGIIPEDRIV